MINPTRLLVTVTSSKIKKLSICTLGTICKILFDSQQKTPNIIPKTVLIVIRKWWLYI